MPGDERIRVVLVDDHEMFAEALGDILAREPDIAVVATASSVRQAREAVPAHKPDVVLMDFELPDGDGAAATEAVKKLRPETKVVMLTGFTDERVLIAALEAGCSGYITKSKAVEEVVAAVRAAYAGEALISADMLARLLPKLRPSSKRAGADLTRREVEVLELLAAGTPTRDIAERLVISPQTVRNHVQNILSKLHVHSKLEAVSSAVREGVIRYPT